MTDTDGARGMSRAAQKKRAAKEKKKTQQQQKPPPGQQCDVDHNEGPTPHRKRIRRDQHNNDEAQVRNQSSSSSAQNSHNSPLLDEVHTSSSEEEDEGELKVPATASASAAASAAASAKIKQCAEQSQGFGLSVTDDDDVGHVQLPSDCHSLRDILLLDDPDGDEDHAAASTQALSSSRVFQSMTSRQRARCALQFLLQDSTTVTEFYKNYWEQKPLHVPSATNSRLDGFLSLASIREFTTATQRGSTPLYYGKDLNVTRLEVQSDGVARRVTLDRVAVAGPPSGGEPNPGSSHEDEDSTSAAAAAFVPVHAPDLWHHYDQDGATIRLLCPHQHSTALHSLLSLLELECGCMVGANAYLTPPGGAQGFAPHYDDIEAFCLQLEGRKRWKVYPPRNTDSTLPRVSSPDYTAADLMDTKPTLDVVLEPGDLLYMPRGWIHQACTLKDKDNDNEQQHSLHVTISCQQQWAWADLLELLLPEALETTIASHASLREGLPRCFLDYMGAQHDDNHRDLPPALAQMQNHQLQSEDEAASSRHKAQQQQNFRDAARKRIMRVAKTALDLIDASCDQMGKRFLSDRVPPALTPSERADTAHTQPLQPHHLVRLVRPGIARLVLENDKAVLYHCADNSIVYHEHALSPMEFELDDGPALEQLLTCVEPHWIGVADLIHDTIEDKVSVAQALYDEGILALRPGV